MAGTVSIVSPPPWRVIQDENASSSSTVFLRRGSGILVLSCPHGGVEAPSELPDRLSGCVEPDTNTAQLAWAVFTALAPLRPSLVIGKITRLKVDLARTRERSAEVESARLAWDEYHGALRSCLDDAVAAHGQAHMLDLHGQTHRPATEVGHMLRNAELLYEAGTLEAGRCSLAAMARLDAWRGVEDAVCGLHAVGSLLEQQGYAAVPSVRQPYPCSGCCCCDPDSSRRCTGFDAAHCWNGKHPDGDGFGECSFFWGADTLRAYGGGGKGDGQLPQYRGNVAAQQLETSWDGCRDSDANIERFGVGIAAAVRGFIEHFYGNQECRD